jgi:hypothetical protein
MIKYLNLLISLFFPALHIVLILSNLMGEKEWITFLKQNLQFQMVTEALHE